MRVAVLDDDAIQSELIQRTLQTLGHECHGFAEGRALLHALQCDAYPFDLLVFDGQRPGSDTLALLRASRVNLHEQASVLVIADRSAEVDAIEALAADADDFMVAPVRPAELAARVKVLLRRADPPPTPAELVVGRFRIDIDGRRVERDGHAIALKHKEFDLALFLFRNLGRLVPRRHVLEAVWGGVGAVSSRSLDTHASRLRTKLGLNADSGFRLAAIYGVGYRLERITPADAATAAATRLPAPP